MNSDIDALLQAATYRAEQSVTNGVLAALTETSSKVNDPGNAVTSNKASVQDTGNIAAEIKKLVDASQGAQANNVAPPKTSSSSAAPQDSGMGETMLRTAAMMTGVGPLVNGLMKLFGSSEPEALPPLERFSHPVAVSVEAGLTRDREYSAIRYSQGGGPQAVEGQGRTPQAAVQVNIQAMDSQSFLDRQDDIARAVREAMLNSSSLNDVVMEL